MKFSKYKRQRITFIFASFLISVIALFFVITSFRENIVFFYSPSELLDLSPKKINQKKMIRVGGLVKEGTIVNLPDSVTEFIITDLSHDVKVRYKGIKPDLFREGQGMVALGFLNDENIFISKELLAKHDENYMPPNVAKSLKK